MWAQTYREWGNGRVLRGVAHYMVDGRALCGYRPHPNTTMVPLDDESVVRSCEACMLRGWGGVRT